MPTESDGRPGLRARKKARTMATIRRCALDLFERQGYEATTVEQIAAAADVSPSTFFRYFPSKEDVVLSDEYDPVIHEAFAAQPAGLRPIQALRQTMRATFAEMPAAARAEFDQRQRLLLTVPALRAAFMSQLAQAATAMEGIVARRTGRTTADPAVRAFAGAVLGVLISVHLHWEPGQDLLGEIDAALAELERPL